MRLLIDTRALTDRYQGGVARVALQLIKAYATEFPEDELICVTTGQGQPSLPPDLVSFKNVKHIHLGLPNKIWGLLSWLNLVSLTQEVEKRAGKIDAAFFPNLGFMGSCGSKDYTLLLHDLSFLIEPRWFSYKQRIWHKLVKAQKLIRGAKHLLAVSETTKRDAVRLLGITDNRITVIPLGPTSVGMACGARLATDGSHSTYRSNSVFVLSMGANDPRKNTATAIKAVELLRQEPGFEDLELVLIGRPYAVRGTRYDAAWIHYIEQPTDADLADLYAHASAFLYPSWYEGYGLPLHEAASFGTPCITSTTGALPETAPATSFANDVASRETIFADPAKPHHWVEALKLALIKRNEPIQTDVQAWQKAAVLMKEKIKL